MSIHVENLTKTYYQRPVVDNLTFSVQPGKVTGFLGPNGAGKTTTMKMLLGLIKPDLGNGLINNQPYRNIVNPGKQVGVLLEPAFHPGRSGYNHLRMVAAGIGCESKRIDEVLKTVDLTDGAKKKIGEYSLGMRQRLGLAAALLGDPDVLILDEPANGLDPGGIRWLRSQIKMFASEGKTVLVSSHVLSEIQQSVDDVVIITQGRLAHAGSVNDLEKYAQRQTYVLTPQQLNLSQILDEQSIDYTLDGDKINTSHVSARELGEICATNHVTTWELGESKTSLEDVFFNLTQPQTGGKHV